MRKILVFVFLVLLAGSDAWASLPQDVRYGIPDVEYFNRRQYGGATQNWKITQNQYDIMYFANNDGVLEYDGGSWKINNQMGPFPVRSVAAIGNKIYTGSFNELGYYQCDSLHQMSYTSFSSFLKEKGYNDFWNIHDWNGHVVFHSEKAICLFNQDELEAIIPAISRFTSTFLVNGLLLVHDEQEGLMEIRGKKAYKIQGGDLFSEKLIGSIHSISEDKIVIATVKRGLFLWDMQEIVKWDVPVNHILESTDVFCGTTYLDNYLVFGTIQNGLVIADKVGSVLMVIDKDKGLGNNTVLSVYVDREGNIWGGLDNGIVKVSFNSAVSFLQGYYNLGTGYAMKKFGGFYYLGTNQGLYGISEENFRDPMKKRGDFIKIPGTSGQIWTLFDDGEHLLCGHHLGVFEITDQGASLITPPGVNGVWLFKTIEEKPNLLLAGTYDGLILLQKQHGKWKFKTKLQGFDESSRYLEWDENNQLWMSHGYNGVFKLSFSADYSSISKVDTFSFTDFPNNQVPLIVTRIQNECVFSGSTGLYSVNKGDNKPKVDERFKSYFETDNYPLHFREDQFQNVWYFYRNKLGVLRYLEDGSYKNIEYPFIPLENKLVNSFEFLYIPDKENAFLGVEDGFAHYSAIDQKNYKLPFKVHIRSFRGNEDTVSYVLNQMGSENLQVIIPAYPFRKNGFVISYAATFYEDDEIAYSNYLEGLDNTFSDWTNSSSRQLSNLWEGEYKFVVKARNRYGVETEPVAFEFVVLPPLHRTKYAFAGYVVALILLTVLLVRNVNKRIEINRQKEKLKQRTRYREQEERLRNDALNAEKEMIRMRNEKLRSDMVHKEKELANSTMHIIQKNEFLTSLKDQLKKLRRLTNRDDMEGKITSLIRKIDKDIDSESYWEVFETHLEQVHEEFLKRLQNKHPDLSTREQKLCAYIKMGMASKEIATLMNISARSVENNRYLLRQKLSAKQGENLTAYIASI